MGIINICPYCETLRDEAAECCSNWKIVLKIDEALGIREKPTIPEF